jgi:hypothetical protein
MGVTGIQSREQGLVSLSAIGLQGKHVIKAPMCRLVHQSVGYIRPASLHSAVLQLASG